ncbi:hypothetical protein DEM34_09335 [Spiribacter halobius]|uniref:Uncharacterized protein n=2 Tax=Sediminicurvatus halobius TaxID=2182432 RepID=A0A2U2N2H4_9GAMM|nr:hypothetical protein DEM34_09335 [Spiribacter halobius]
MVEVDYYSFRQLLREAAHRGGRIEKRDTRRWNDYVRAHNINEVGATAIARSRFEEPTPVIIDLGGERDGLYLYSDLEEGCLRLVRQDG